ncbi:uncharacterized protein LOC125245645 [Megalobrama amblycephala]|uniref:uncharacterized protein LOC125245645 n=1 Tax=Megalobrama amblycephala TaxID=75352 RepID=UPI002013E606|nr:uncharacterized protein LOC125245645 [Megalobrama amblycephala]
MMDECFHEKDYLVSRRIYSNRVFDQVHERRDQEIQSLREQLSRTCGCTDKWAVQKIKGLLPILDWLPKYPVKQWLPSDVVSGVTTGLVCCLQGVAYALLASVAPVYGLYSAFFPILTYFVLGTSRHISVGPFPVTCLMVGSVVLTLAPDEHFLRSVNITAVNETVTDERLMEVDVEAREAQRIMVACTMTVLVGLFQVAMGLMQVGFLVRYLSDPLVGGFTTAAAFHVFISQIKTILSVPTHNHNGFFSIAYTLIDVGRNINQTNIADLIAGLLTIFIVMVVKEINTKFQHKIPVPIPIEVIVTVIASAISHVMDLNSQYGASIVHSLPRGFAPAQPPNIALIGSILGSSFSTAVVGYAVAVSVAKVYAAKHDYTVDGNQELIAFGVSNIFGGCLSSFVASTALSRTAVQESTGGKSQVAGIISALMVMIVILALGPFLQPLQKSVLAGIVIANLKGMFMQISEVPVLWRQNRTDCLIWIATCLASIALGLDVGLLAGLVFEMGTVVVRTQFPSCATLGNVPNTDIYKNMKDYKNIDEIPGIKIFKCKSPIYFANIDYFKEKLRDEVGFDAVRVFKKRNKALKKIHKLIKKGKLQATEDGLVPVASLGVENKAFENEQSPELEEGASQQDSEVKVQVDWTSELPVGVSVPRVHIHSLVVDFSAVSFLDVVAAKSLKLVVKEFIRIGVSVYIAGCDGELVRRMEALSFFDEEVTRDLLFLSVHDAILFIQLETSSGNEQDSLAEKISKLQDDKEPLPFTEDEDLIETYDNQHLLYGRTMLRPSTQKYAVNRPLYSEDTFEDEHAKVYRKHKRLLDHFIQYFTCTSERAKNAAISLLPIIGWIRIYPIKEWLLNDIVSGVSTGLVAVLQGLAFSLLASISTWYGLYAAFFPVIIYFFLGTSRHISVGSFPVLSLMVGAAVTRLVPDEGPPANITAFEGLTKDEQRILVSASLTVLVGLFQLGMGLLQVGFIVMYLSDTLISGFTTAAAVHILISQLKFILGLTVPGFSGPLAIIYTLESVFTQITSTNIHDLVTSIVVMVLVLGVKEINDRFKSKLPVPIPIEVIVTIIACGVSYAFKFSENHGVDVVGKIPNTFESPMAPDLQVFQMTAMEAFPIAIVGFAVAFAVAKVYSVKHDYVIDGNQELIAFGASNIFGGSFKSLAASTALSRSAVQESTGGKTQIAGLISAIIVLVVILGIGFLLEPLPKSLLGAVVVVNLKGMLMQVVSVPYLWKKDRPDCIVWVGTCLAAIFLGLDIGLAIGLGLELLTVVFRAQFPRCSVLANISGTDIYRDRKDYVNIYEPEGVKIFKIPSPIFFANIDFFRDKLKDAVGFNPLRILRKRNKAVKKIKKLIKKGELTLTANGLQATCSMPIEESEDESNMEDLDKPTDYSDLPIQVNWNAELPANIQVPPVNIHSLVLDFSAVSFLDISALKGLQAALKEFIRIDVDIYIVGCDSYIIEKLKSCKFFDDEIKTSIFFLTIHDAMLYIYESHPPKTVSEKVSGSFQYQHINGSSMSNGLTSQEMPNMKMEVETDTKPETRF